MKYVVLGTLGLLDVVRLPGRTLSRSSGNEIGYPSKQTSFQNKHNAHIPNLPDVQVAKTKFLCSKVGVQTIATAITTDYLTFPGKLREDRFCREFET